MPDNIWSSVTHKWRRQWHPTPVLLPGKSHGWRSLVGYSPLGRKESNMTERLHFHFSLSCIREGNGNPLQRSCLENPGDGGAWWAAVYGVAQSRTRLKRLSRNTIYIYMYMHILFIFLFHYGLSQDTEYSSPCYIVGPSYLSIYPKLLIYPSFPSSLVAISLFSMSLSLFLFCNYDHLYFFFRFHTQVISNDIVFLCLT